MTKPAISAEQCRMGRAALGGIGIRELAELSGIGVTTLTRLEAGDGTVKPATIDRLISAFEERGVTFSSGRGWVGVKVAVKVGG